VAAEPFKGNEKHGTSLLMNWENQFRARWVRRLPSWLETWHLTYLTLLWSGLIVLCGWQARENLNWLWLSSLMVVAQYLSDLFDGALGRYRNTGLIKWGYYMDHFLDYLFQSAIITGYLLIAPEGLTLYFIGMLVLSTGFMVSSFLSFAATNRFEIYFLGIGPTEIRVAIIALNTAIILLGTDWWPVTVPIFFWCLTIGLTAMVWQTQRQLWQQDMRLKRTSQSSEEEA
jgi:phosphatidylglycerophosphate synthase